MHMNELYESIQYYMCKRVNDSGGKKTYQKDLIFPKPRNLDGQRIEILLSLIAAERAARMTLRRASRMTKHN